MREILIVKVGSTLPALISGKGDFEDWILAGMGLPRHAVQVVDVRNGVPLPAHGAVSGVVITGSHEFVTEHLPWSERVAEWLRGAVARRLPVLGICYGHQVLAYALGGEVGDNPNGLDFGTVTLQLTPQAVGDPLLGGLPQPIYAHVSHSQSVLRLPEGARRLACSEIEPNQAFVIGEEVWGVQFHPEFDAAVVVAYIDAFQDALRQEGRDPGRLRDSCRPAPAGPEILRRFARIAGREEAAER
jgi:GMP synthase (glutamine-hydrolysing)